MLCPHLFPLFPKKRGGDAHPAQPKARQKRPGRSGKGTQVGGIRADLNLIQVVEGGHFFIDGIQRRTIGALLPSDGLADLLNQLPRSLPQGGGAVEYGGHKGVLAVFQQNSGCCQLHGIVGIIVLACPAQVVQIGGILPGFFCDGYIAFRLGIGDLHIICEQKLCKQPGSQHLLRVILLEQAYAGTLRDHFGMLRVILGHGVYDGLKADDRVFTDVQQGSVAAHPGGTRGGINGENALAGVQKIGGIAGDFEGGERAGGSVLGNGFQQLSGLSVPQLHRAVAPGIGGVQLGKALNHHIIRGLVDEGNQYLLAVELVCPVGIFRRSGLTDLPDEVPGQGFRQGEAQLLHKVFVDVAGLRGAHIGQGVGGPADLCKIVSILAVLSRKNPGLCLVLLCLLPVLFAFTRYVQKNMLKAQLENRRAVGRAAAFVPQTLHNIRTIHALGKERYMCACYDCFIGQSYGAMEKTNFYDAIYSPIILILNALVVGIVMLLSAAGDASVLRVFGMSAGTAVAVIGYISQIFTPVESLGMEIQAIQSAMAGVRRIDEILAEPERSMPPETKEPVSGAAAAELRNVTFGYDEKDVLQNVSLRVEAGEQVTLAGRTGAGKSTVLKLLLGLYPPKAGQALLFGIPAEKIPEGDKRYLIGYVEQSFHMVPGTVREQITLYDNRITEAQVRKAAELVGLLKTIEALDKGFDTPCAPELFSQGQWQLLSIARAAVTDPKLLLLDEITANLDAETEHMVLEALNRVSENRTVISISHRASARTGRIVTVTPQV